MADAIEEELALGRSIFRRMRIAGCGFSLREDGGLVVTGETPPDELLALAQSHEFALGNAVAQIMGMERLLRQRVSEGADGIVIAKAILIADPVNPTIARTVRAASARSR